MWISCKGILQRNPAAPSSIDNYLPYEKTPINLTKVIYPEPGKGGTVELVWGLQRSLIIIGPSSHPRLVAKAAKTSSAQLSRQNPGGQRCYGIEPPGFLRTRMALVHPTWENRGLNPSPAPHATRLPGSWARLTRHSSAAPHLLILSSLEWILMRKQFEIEIYWASRHPCFLGDFSIPHW